MNAINAFFLLLCHAFLLYSPTASCAYDKNNRLKTVTGPDNLTTTYEYSAGGQVKSVNYAGLASKFTYNALNQVTQATDPSGRVSSATYDAFGLQKTQTTGGLTTTYAYDPQTRQLTSVTAPGGLTTNIYHDTRGQVNAVSDPGGNLTRYVRDDLGRVVQTIFPDGSTEQVTYKNAGAGPDPDTHTNRAGKVSRLAFDGAGRLTGRTFLGSGLSVGYAYDGHGHVSNDGSAHYEYDLRGRVKSASDASYTYNADDTLATKTVAGQQHVYRYDPQTGRLTGISRADGAVAFGYDAFGRINSHTLPNGVSRGLTFDGTGRVTGMTQSGGGVTESYTYGYDGAGRRTSLSKGGTYSISYGYDGAGRLASEVRSGQGASARSYNYDDNNNRVAEETALGVTPVKFVFSEIITKSTKY